MACPKCGYELVNLKKSIHDTDKPICPKCKIEMEQVFEKMPGVVFKGVGWTPKIGGGRMK
jgi:predicted nucleic acid-binding Zn ribbon protein